METKKMNIRQKLSAIQNELKAPKNQRNNFGKYNYRSAEDILEAVKPLCHKYNTCLVIDDELVNIGDRYYINARATLYDNESDTEIVANGYAREEENKKGMDGSQITGASSSYSRKYAMNGLFNIDDTKDSDATNQHDSPKNETPSKKIKKPEPVNKKFAVKSLDGLISALEANTEKTLDKIKSDKFFSKAQYDELKGTGLLTGEELKSLEVR